VGDAEQFEGAALKWAGVVIWVKAGRPSAGGDSYDGRGVGVKVAGCEPSARRAK
jgi:hypothetical protein